MTSIASGENNNLETWKQILESVFDNQKLNTTILTGIVNGSSVEFVKQTGSEEQPGLIKIKCLIFYDRARLKFREGGVGAFCTFECNW